MDQKYCMVLCDIKNLQTAKAFKCSIKTLLPEN